MQFLSEPGDRHGLYGLMTVAVGPYFVPRRSDLLGKRWVRLGDLPEDEEGGPDTRLSQQLDQGMGVGDNPAADWQGVIKRRLRPVLDVNAQEMKWLAHLVPPGCQVTAGFRSSTLASPRSAARFDRLKYRGKDSQRLELFPRRRYPMMLSE